MKKLLASLPLLLSLSLLGLASKAQAAPQIQSWTLANGVRVLLVENHAIPMLDMRVDFDAGARRDTPGKSGLASLTLGLLSSGVAATKDGIDANGAAQPALSEAQILDGFADIAAQPQSSLDSDRADIGLRTLSAATERDAAVTLLARMLAQSSLPIALFERDRTLQIAAVREAQTRPAYIAAQAFMARLYGTHPYGQSPSVASLEAISHADVQTFYRSHYVARNAVVSLVGDVTKAQADAIAQQLTRNLPQGDALPAMPEVPPAAASEQQIPHPASQAHILIGAPALVRGDPDFFALLVGNHILGGGGLVSRLSEEVREKRALTYGISSGFSGMKQAGPFQIKVQTKKEQTAQALQVTRDTLAKFLRDGPSEAEMQAAKDNLIGGFPLNIDTNGKLLQLVTLIGYYGLPLDYADTWTANVARVTRADVLQAFRRKLDAGRMSTVVVGGTL
ncbi:pitrilysin family protein [Herbaspirillum sp. RTI4]|uniref:M16 family metallopeptidase n=1 Tax=Herbaspirillum sp. RTI4 TaxID=3048640 RepID=UPI002AB3E817|nr:pitrilysin family protein [Herbaspirillum sp. RTI4]MDY7577714.1 pitrilysin family protein [Herbaspirillum sp. RTI4]MEA9980858.1 pitrilysin family protein [Herbaspirillum sp. RTI4]